LKLENIKLEKVMVEDREQVPRKQGLKPVVAHLRHPVPGDREQVPRKQGLKHAFSDSVFDGVPGIESKFHENKD